MKSIRERNPVAVGVSGIALLTVLALLAFYSDALPVIGGGTTYAANFTEAAGMDPGNEVRVAGVKVGKVTDVALEGGHVKVTFKVKDTWIGDASTVAIEIKTLLGEKYLAVDPLGAHSQDPRSRIPTSRTVSPYDVTEAFNGLARTVEQIDTARLAQSLQTISGTFRNTPPHVRKALDGLSSLSKTIAGRDAELARLLAGTRRLSGTLAGQNTQFEGLLKDGNLLLAELQRRREAIGALLKGVQALAVQLSGLVADNQARLRPMLRSLEQVTEVLDRNQRSLNRALALAGPYYRLVGNTIGNGRWFDSYLCGLVPRSYLPPGTGPDRGCMPPKQGGSR